MSFPLNQLHPSRHVRLNTFLSLSALLLTYSSPIHATISQNNTLVAPDALSAQCESLAPLSSVGSQMHIENCHKALLISSLPAASAWMSVLSDTTKFGQIAIPGTHDSAARDTPLHAGETQDWDIATQLNNGIRFLDVRIINSSNGFELRHGIVPLGDFEQKVMIPVNRFLQEHPSEFIVMSIKNEGSDELNKQKLEDEFIYAPGSKFYPETITGQTAISELRGNIVLADRYGAIRQSGFAWGNAKIQDEYELVCERSLLDFYLSWDYPKKGKAVINHFQQA